MKLCRIATVPFVFSYHLYSQITAAIERKHEVYLVSSMDPALEIVAKETGASAYSIDIQRSISPWKDLQSLFKLTFYFRKMRFDTVHSITQKAGLLTSLAGFITRVPVRLHTFTGQPWMYKKGLVRWVSKACDWLIVRLNTMCYADSKSQQDYLIRQGIGNERKIKVLGQGSLAGVDLQKFNLAKWKSSSHQIRQELNISDGAIVINFTGRINLEKGVRELIEAFEGLQIGQREVVLLLVGPFEVDREPIPFELVQRIQNNPQIRILGNSPQAEKYFAISDLLCLPSYREGFGIVVLEAAAMGVTTVGTRIVGLIDSVIDGKTGVLVPPKDSQSLREALTALLEDDKLRRELGKNAMNHAKSFDSKHVNAMVLKEYDELMTGASQHDERCS